MAKKKKKAAKKVAKKKASEPAAVDAQEGSEAGPCSDQELVAAGVVTTAGELMSGVVNALVREIEARGVDVADLLHTVVASLQRSQPSERVSGEENGQSGWEYARRRFERRDDGDLPHLRFVGRVIDILLNHRRFQTCTTGNVFRVFLVEIPNQLEVNHQQHPVPGRDVDVTMQPARRTFNNRMDRLCEEELIQPTITRETGRREGYVLTEDGRNMFDGWPPLSDIPGLALDGTVRPDSEPRRRS
jgi:hypothetical protein